MHVKRMQMRSVVDWFQLFGIEREACFKKAGENLLDEKTSVWCGTTIKADDGRYHFFYSRMADNCGLLSWTHNSEIWHTSGTSPYGPWSTNATRLLSRFAHGPHIVRGPKSEGSPYLLFHIGDANSPPPPLYCKDGFTPPECITDPSKCYKNVSRELEVRAGSHWMGILMANSLTDPAPWKDVEIKGNGLEATNPSAYVFDNGTTLLAYRYNPSGTERIALARADHWTGPYTIVHQPLFKESYAVDEDPYIWRDTRGNFHMLTHHFHPQGGVHAFSSDGLNWTYGGMAFGSEVKWDDGTTMSMTRRERPELVFDDSGKPILLFNGACPRPADGDFSFGMVQPLMT